MRSPTLAIQHVGSGQVGNFCPSGEEITRRMNRKKLSTPGKKLFSHQFHAKTSHFVDEMRGPSACIAAHPSANLSSSAIHFSTLFYPAQTCSLAVPHQTLQCSAFCGPLTLHWLHQFKASSISSSLPPLVQLSLRQIRTKSFNPEKATATTITVRDMVSCNCAADLK